MRSRKLLREAGFAALFLLLTVFLLQLAGAVLRPPQVSYGSTWRAYRAEPKNSIDVLYFGSSYAYCDYDPVEVYRETGLTGYVMGGSEQTMSITYWYLREALDTQNPSAVVIEPTGVFFERYQSFTQTNLVYMPFSLNKLGAVFTAAEPALRPGLLFDLWFYHDRWREVTLSDALERLSPARPDEKKGNTPVQGTAQELPGAPVRSGMSISGEQYQENLNWLDRCLSLCRARKIPVLLLVNPTYSQYLPEVYGELEEHVRRTAPEAHFVNWSDAWDALGLTPALHLYDGGHLNHDGAILYSHAVGRLLQEELALVPRPQSGANAAAWDALLQRCDAPNA